MIAADTAIAVDRAVKIYKNGMAVNGISFSLAAGSVTALLGGNGAGKTTTIAMIMGLVTPTSGTVSVLGAQMPERAAPCAAPDEFRKPLCRHADAAHGAAEPHRVRPALRRARCGARIRELGSAIRSQRFSRPADRQIVVRPEDARLARQGAAQPSGDSAARRADRLARSRHRRLGARRDRKISRRAGRHHPARLAQHGRGRAALRPRHHDEARRDRRRRFARHAARALRPRKSRGRVSRHRARPKAGAGACAAQENAAGAAS